MELRHFHYFVAVAELENMTRAAERLFVTQPTLSRQMKDIEEELGVALFERSAKSLKLTEAGRAFLSEAREVLARSERAIQVAKEVGRGQSGELRLAYSPSLSVEMLPKLLRFFREIHPKVEVSLFDESTQGMLRGVQQGDYDVALAVRMEGRSFVGLDFHEIEHHAVCIACHPSHHFSLRQTLGVRDVLDEPLVGFCRTDYPEYHEWVEGLYAPHGKQPRWVEELDSVNSLIMAVESGRGLAFVSQRLECLVGARLRVLPLSPAPVPLSIGAVSRSEEGSLLAAHFVRAVQAWTQSQPATKQVRDR